GSLWVRRRLAEGDWKCLKRLGDPWSLGEAGREALCHYLQSIGKPSAMGAQRRRSILRKFLREHGPRLRADTFAWGSAVCGLAAPGTYEDAARFGADYAARADAQPWMLINLVIAQRALGQDREANAAGRHALGLTADYTTRYHHIWLALD